MPPFKCTAPSGEPIYILPDEDEPVCIALSVADLDKWVEQDASHAMVDYIIETLTTRAHKLGEALVHPHVRACMGVLRDCERTCAPGVQAEHLMRQIEPSDMRIIAAQLGWDPWWAAVEAGIRVFDDAETARSILADHDLMLFDIEGGPILCSQWRLAQPGARCEDIGRLPLAAGFLLPLLRGEAEEVYASLDECAELRRLLLADGSLQEWVNTVFAVATVDIV